MAVIKEAVTDGILKALGIVQSPTDSSNGSTDLAGGSTDLAGDDDESREVNII